MKKFLFLLLVLLNLVDCGFSQPKLKPLKDEYMSGNLVPQLKKSKWGYVLEGREDLGFVIDDKFTEARPFVNGVAIVKYKKKYGLLNRTGVFAVVPTYDVFNDFTNGYAIVSKDSLYGTIDVTGEERCPLCFEKYESRKDEGIEPLLIRSNGLYGTLNDHGYIDVNPRYSDVRAMDQGVMLVMEKGKTGTVDGNLHALIPTIYDSIQVMDRDRIRVFEGARCGMAKNNEGGDVLIPIQYDMVSRHGSYYVTNLNDRYGAFSSSCQELFPPFLDSTPSLNDEVKPFSQNGYFALASIYKGMSWRCEKLLLLDNLSNLTIPTSPLDSLELDANTKLYYKSNIPYYVKSKEDMLWAANRKIENWAKMRRFEVNDVTFYMMYVKAGAFTMGESYGGERLYSDENPHRVELTKDYYVGETEVTQRLWLAVMGTNPSSSTDNLDCPVNNVTWNDCRVFIRRLNRLTGLNFRLPTEAEWEYAARGGISAKKTTFSGSNDLDDVGVFEDNKESSIAPAVVKSKECNELGIFDMSGNVQEWCQDWYSSTYYNISPKEDPTGPDEGRGKVRRGGGFLDNKALCSLKFRNCNSLLFKSPELGLRLVL